jgi:hypothetical protein
MQQPGILQPAESDSPSIGHRRFTECECAGGCQPAGAVAAPAGRPRPWRGGGQWWCTALCGMRHQPLTITLVLAAAGGLAPTAAAAAEVNLLFLLIDDLVRRGLVLLVTALTAAKGAVAHTCPAAGFQRHGLEPAAERLQRRGWGRPPGRQDASHRRYGAQVRRCLLPCGRHRPG